MLIPAVAFLVFLYLCYTNLPPMSNNPTQQQKDAANFDPNNMMVNMGGRLVPFSQINKPHHVVIEPKDHHAINTQDFPDIEPEAKAREAKLAEERKKD